MSRMLKGSRWRRKGEVLSWIFVEYRLLENDVIVTGPEHRTGTMAVPFEEFEQRWERV